nr:MAG TPA: hypothetical protein [Caudoviricetes sp.]
MVTLFLFYYTTQFSTFYKNILFNDSIAIFFTKIHITFREQCKPFRHIISIL